jgi:hypothetical protein
MSLKEMFAGLTAAAVFCWCSSQAGFENGYFWFATLIGGAMTFVWWMCARRPHGRWLAALVPVGFAFFCGLALTSVTTMWLGGLMFIAGIVCAILGPLSGRALAHVATSLFLTAFVIGGIEGRRAGQELDLARQRNPIVSLAPRLAYELRGPTAAATEPSLTLASAVETSLQHSEQIEDEVRGEYFGRIGSLQALHERAYDDFVRAAGFGVGRMPLPRPGRVDRPALADIAFNAPSQPSEADGLNCWNLPYREGRGETPGDFHLLSRDDFLNPEGFGWIKTRLDEVAGFVPHAFHARVAREDKPLAWAVERLELVSLLKFDAPRVYVLDHLPRMDQLSGEDVPTRELDAFEQQALTRLRTQEDVVVESAGEATRMLGSLRAGRQCLDCHAVPRGELLGAFSYTLKEGARGEERAAVEKDVATKRERGIGG